MWAESGARTLDGRTSRHRLAVTVAAWTCGDRGTTAPVMEAQRRSLRRRATCIRGSDGPFERIRGGHLLLGHRREFGPDRRSGAWCRSGESGDPPLSRARHHQQGRHSVERRPHGRGRAAAPRRLARQSDLTAGGPRKLARIGRTHPSQGIQSRHHPAPRPLARHVPGAQSRPPQWRSGHRRSAGSGLDGLPAALACRHP